MAYADANLYRVAELGNGKSLWCYHTTDAVTDVDGANYFLSAIGKLKVGDVILVNVYTSAITGAIATSGFVFVNSNTGTAIDTTDVLAITATDSD
jgi:hypothetical protein